jgi:5-methylcytosine-specific restriction endonuclease McrA
MSDYISKSRSLAFTRSLAFRLQSGHCYYCGCCMWENSPAEFARQHGITEREAHRFKCTAEHLLARQDGGTDARENIVAACRFCNSSRHRRVHALRPEEHRRRVRARLKHGKWHPKQYRRLLTNVVPGRDMT